MLFPPRWTGIAALPAMAALVLFFGVSAAAAQTNETVGRFDPGQEIGLPQSTVLLIQPDKLFSESAFGRRVTGDLEAELAVLTAENRRIEAELRAEELDLTERRKTMPAEAFRVLADAFDASVQETRATQEAKYEGINSRFEAARLAFLKASEPVLEQLMIEAGASAIIDRSAVLLAAASADITDVAILRINAVLGEGEAGLSDGQD